MNVQKIMKTDLVTIQADETVQQAVAICAAAHIRHLPVLEGEELIGIITQNDIRHATPSPIGEAGEEANHAFLATPVRRVMKRAPITASPNQKLRDVVHLMVENKIGAVPVVSAGRLVGIVSELDVMRCLLQILDLLE
ncbi:CBS domain-containing protein [bacterium]|nr:CBS domain-containing protein [bacterium]